MVWNDSVRPPPLNTMEQKIIFQFYTVSMFGRHAPVAHSLLLHVKTFNAVSIFLCLTPPSQCLCLYTVKPSCCKSTAWGFENCKNIFGINHSKFMQKTINDLTEGHNEQENRVCWQEIIINSIAHYYWKWSYNHLEMYFYFSINRHVFILPTWPFE